MWSFHTVKGEFLGQIATDSVLHIGRNSASTVINIRTNNVRVSRKHILLNVKADKILCRVDGINQVHVYKIPVENKTNKKRSELCPTKKSKGEEFELLHNEILELNIFKKEGDSIKIVVCKNGLPRSFDFAFNENEVKEIPKKRRNSYVIGETPKKLRRVSSLGGQNINKKDDVEDEEGIRESIVDKLGDLFNYETVMTDPEHAQRGGSRIGSEFQVKVNRKLNKLNKTIKTTKEIRTVLKDKQTMNEIRLNLKTLPRFMLDSDKANGLTDIYIAGLSLFYPEAKLKSWSFDERTAFLNSIYKFPKLFDYVASEINKELKLNDKDRVGWKDCNEYYYLQFKKTTEYETWKQSFGGKDNFNAGANMSHFLETLFADEQKFDNIAEDLDIKPEYESEEETTKKKRKNGSRKTNKKVNELARLVDAGIIKSGNDSIYINYQSKKIFGELLLDGGIMFDGKRFESASSWSYFVKKKLNPKVRSDNGWSSVQFEGKSLSYYRDLFDPGMKVSVAKSNNIKDEEFDNIPELYEDFYPTLETTPISEVKRLLSSLTFKGQLIIFSNNEGFNVRTSIGKEKSCLLIDSKSNFYIKDPSISSRKYNSLYSWFKSKNFGGMDFFSDCEVLCFPTLDAEEPVFRSIKKLYFDWKRAKIDAIKAKLAAQQKLLDGKRATTSRLVGLKIGKNELAEEKKEITSWSKYDRYCKCQKKFIESSTDDWYIQCSKGSSFCNGWVHPKCFDLDISKAQSENIENFICPLCSFDSTEFAVVDNIKPENPSEEKLWFKDVKTDGFFEAKALNSKNKNIEEKLRRVIYLKGTKIRSLVAKDNILLGWCSAKVIEWNKSLRKYKVEYDLAPGDFNMIDIERNPTHMLERDWKQTQFFKYQNAILRYSIKPTKAKTQRQQNQCTQTELLLSNATT